MTEKKKSGLPAMQQQVDEMVAKQEKELNRELINLQAYVAINNKPVAAEKLVEHPIAKGVKYLPISYMETLLDQVYFGLWETVNFRWFVIANEISASIDLRVFHPIAKQWITRTGTAAKKIMTDSIPEQQYKTMTQKQRNQWSLDLENKKPSALEMGEMGALKAECFKNACLSLGKQFGRDVNREHKSTYEAFIKPQDETMKEIRFELSELLDHIQDQELRDSYIDRIVDAENRKVNSLAFYRKLIKELKHGK